MCPSLWLIFWRKLWDCRFQFGAMSIPSVEGDGQAKGLGISGISSEWEKCQAIRQHLRGEGKCDLRRGNFRKCKGSLQALDSWIPDAALDPHGRGGWKAPAVRGPFTRWNQLPLQVILQAGRGSPGGLWLMDDPEVFGDGESEGPQRAAFHRPFPTII